MQKEFAVLFEWQFILHDFSIGAPEGVEQRVAKLTIGFKFPAIL